MPESVDFWPSAGATRLVAVRMQRKCPATNKSYSGYATIITNGRADTRLVRSSGSCLHGRAGIRTSSLETESPPERPSLFSAPREKKPGTRPGIPKRWALWCPRKRRQGQSSRPRSAVPRAGLHGEGMLLRSEWPRSGESDVTT